MKFNMDSLKGLVEQVKNKGTEYAGAAADKAKDAAALAKLKVELSGEKEALRKAYLELGKTCYEEKAVAPEGVLGQLMGEVESARGRIDALQKEIEALMGNGKDPSEDFEQTVAQSEPDIEVEITQEPEENEPKE